MSQSPNAAQTLLEQLRSSLDGASYSTSAVYASVVIAFGGAAAVSALVFLLWHRCRDIYAAKDMLAARLDAIKGKAEKLVLPRLRSSIRTCWKFEESGLLKESGLDAVVYLRSLHMIRNIFAVLTVVLFGASAPINIYFNLHNSLGVKLGKRDALLLLTPSLLSNMKMIPHVVLGWVANCIVFAFLWYNYVRILRMRQNVLCDDHYRSQIENRTVLVMDIPKSSRSFEGVARVVKAINPHVPPSEITLGRSSKKLRELTAEYETKVKLYERAVVDKSSITSRIELKESYDRLAREVEFERTAALGPPLCYAFVSYDTQYEAHETVRRSRNVPDGIKLRVAPPPSQIIWNNIGLGPAERGAKQMWVNTVYGALLLLWIVPNAFIGCFISNLSRLAAVWPAFGRAMASNRVGFAILQGFLAPTITTMVFMFLPFLFRKLSFLQGKVTRTDREHEVLRKLYAFFFLDNFFVFSIMGVIWDIVAQVLQVTHKARSNGQHLSFQEVWHTLRIGQRIATAIVNISSFWVMYLFRAVLSEFANSAQPKALLCRMGQLFSFIRKPTAREKAEASMPQPFQYAVSFLAVLFHTTIALGFTTIQPLVLPICFVLYLLAIPIKKYELVHMQITKYESNGLFWPLVVDIVLFATAFGNLMLLCVVWVQAGWRIATAAAPLAATVILFKILVYFKFDVHFFYADSTKSPLRALSLPLHKANEDSTSEKMKQCYEDPVRNMVLSGPLLTFEDALCFVSGTKVSLPSYEDPFKPELQRQSSHESDGLFESVAGFSKESTFNGARASVPYTPIEPDAAFGYDNDSLYAYEPYAAGRHGQPYGYYNGEAYQPFTFNEHHLGEQTSHDHHSSRPVTDDQQRLL